MVEVVSVKFKNRGKIFYFDPRGLDVPVGAQVVVETSKGLDLCRCVEGRHTVTDERIVPPLRPVVRIATANDLRVAELSKEREAEAMVICRRKIGEHGLPMKLVDCECSFDGGKIIFFFTADGRVDFRALVRDLAGEFRTRIELRQIGVRDEAQMLGGIGMCGRPYCCSQFLNDFAPVSTKMAKVQSLSLNPTKISGCCGRLMCCLRYEQKSYEELVKTVPKTGAFVETADGYGSVAAVNLLRQTVKVKLDADSEGYRFYPVDEVAAVPGGRPKNGEAPPHVLVLKPKEKEVPAEPEPDDWARPPMFAEDTAERPAQGKSQRRRGGNKNRKPQQDGGGQRTKSAAEQGGRKKQNQNQNQNQNQKSAAPKPKKSGQNRQNRPKNKGGAPAETP